MDTHRMIENRISSFFQELDARNWRDLEQMLSPQIHFEDHWLGRDETSQIEASEALDIMEQYLRGFDSTHHQLGNLLIEYQEQKACARVYTTNSLFINGARGGELLTLFGIYDLSLVYYGGEWQINYLKFIYKFHQGNEVLPELATRKGASEGRL
ncbi:nuclear transport factor 2 family protein [Pseudovibrio flavus]|uniref:nuclear transport factor 2 family protein n=1 Tax=Pseudovibrio flavus TaxID=2529854 RepID=UPI00211CD97C|nr:nuclear transport factor 2 family protein [Pseudovibrio flavus]